MNKYLVKIDPDGISGSEIIEVPPFWSDSLAGAEEEFISSYPGLAVYPYTIELVPLRNQICIPFNIRYWGWNQTSYSTQMTAEDGPLVIFDSPADYGFPEFTNMHFKFKFKGYNTGVAHGFMRVATDNNGTGTYTGVANTEVEVLTQTLATYTSGTWLSLTPGIYFVQGKCGSALQTTWECGAWLIITFS